MADENSKLQTKVTNPKAAIALGKAYPGTLPSSLRGADKKRSTVRNDSRRGSSR